MHGETNNSPRHAPCTVRLATISHRLASSTTSTEPNRLKKARPRVLASFKVASE
ncbi:hypothetical protein D3C81_2289250 [compost metagenome]